MNKLGQQRDNATRRSWLSENQHASIINPVLWLTATTDISSLSHVCRLGTTETPTPRHYSTHILILRSIRERPGLPLSHTSAAPVGIVGEMRIEELILDGLFPLMPHCDGDKY